MNACLHLEGKWYKCNIIKKKYIYERGKQREKVGDVRRIEAW